MGRKTKADLFDQIVYKLLERNAQFQLHDLLVATPFSKAGVHFHLKRLLETGALRREGRGPATRYVRDRPASPARAPGVNEVRRSFALQGLEEDRVWTDLAADQPILMALPKAAQDIAQFAFLELLNNAIDHSGGKRVEIRVMAENGRFGFELHDDGEGVFEHVRRTLGLASLTEAPQELSKGKVTTDPTRHTGQGIFFSARSLDLMSLESNGLVWIVDTLRNDTALGESPVVHGTRATGWIARDTTRTIKEVFDAHSDENYAFSKTHTWVKLFQLGLSFVSRSEARRLLHGVEKFDEIVLDFAGISQVGQGFADEIFRVWANAHPTIRIRAVNAVAPVEAMLRRARPEPSRQ